MTLEWTEPEMLDPAWVEGLLAPDKMFGLVDEDVLGCKLPVFALRPRSIRQVLLDGGEKHGDREALIGHERTVSFAGLPAEVAAVARRLRDEYGVAPGDRVGFAGIPSVEHAISLWAVMSMGAVAATFNPAWTVGEFEYAIDTTACRLVLCDDVVLERLGDRDEVEAFADFFQEVDATGLSTDDLPGADVAEDDPAAIVFTSGTTGRPKGATLSHRNVIQFCLAAAATTAVHSLAFGLSPGGGSVSTVVACSPLFHVSGLLGQLANSAFWGTRLVFAPPGRWDETVHLELTERHQVTQWSLVPTQLWRLVDHPRLAEFDLSTLEMIGGGGAMFAPELLRHAAAVLPNVSMALRVGYGMTEASGPVTILQPPYDDHARASVGRAVAGNRIQICGPDGTQLSDGEIGEIRVQGAQVFLGYWGDDEATSKVLTEDRWYSTGDFGRIDDGLLFLESRRSDLIIRGGENIYPIEIENRLIEHEAVAEVAVVGVDHQTLGQEVKAVVVLHEGATVETSDLQDFARVTLARFKVPSIVEFVDELPHNATGKVLKSELDG